MKKFVVASLVFEFMALASVAFLVFTAPPPGEPSRHRHALPTVQDDVALTRSRLEAAQTKILWNVMALIGISMAAQAAGLIAAGRASSGARPAVTEES